MRRRYGIGVTISGGVGVGVGVSPGIGMGVGLGTTPSVPVWLPGEGGPSTSSSASTKVQPILSGFESPPVADPVQVAPAA